MGGRGDELAGERHALTLGSNHKRQGAALALPEATTTRRRCAVAAITTKDGVRAKGLDDLLGQETGSTLSITRFGSAMNRHVADPHVPFGPKVQTMHGTFYPLKAEG